MSYSYPHPAPWNGKDLKGEYHVTVKIDGVRMLRDECGNPVSRNGKPLFNLEHVPQEISDAEIFYGDWESSITHVRSSVTDVGPVDADHVFSLFPTVDERLDLGYITNPTAPEIKAILQIVIDDGKEGLVLRQTDGKKLLKVKPKETFDVSVNAMIMGTGKHAGRMGALLTPRGKVGTGFTDKQRQEWYDWFMKQDCIVYNEMAEKPTEYHLTAHCETPIIEVDCWELTSGGKFRHPRYIRLREDK